MEILRSFEIISILLSIFTALTETFSVIILMITACLMWKQIREMRLTTYAGAFKATYDLLQADDVREARRVVLESLTNKAVEPWTVEERKAAEIVCSSYDAVGIMARNGMVPVEVVADSWGDSLRRTWKILSPLVALYRAQRNASEFWNEYEWLAKQAESHQKAVHI